METQKTTIKIDGIEIEITGEMKRSWYKMINDTRNEARKTAPADKQVIGAATVTALSVRGIFPASLSVMKKPL